MPLVGLGLSMDMLTLRVVVMLLEKLMSEKSQGNRVGCCWGLFVT